MKALSHSHPQTISARSRNEIHISSLCAKTCPVGDFSLVLRINCSNGVGMLKS